MYSLGPVLSHFSDWPGKIWTSGRKAKNQFEKIKARKTKKTDKFTKWGLEKQLLRESWWCGRRGHDDVRTS